MSKVEQQGGTSVSGAQDAQWWVFCLCAGWCGVCREYRSGFEELGARFPAVRWAWVDVEDQEDVVGDWDIETFPTLLIGCGADAVFLGPLLPQISVLERLLASYVDEGPARGVSGPSSALFQRLVQAHSPG